MSDAATVELRPAFEWICEDCGRSAFASAVRVEDPKIIADIENEYGCSGQLMMGPSSVTCPSCGSEFRTEQPE